MTEHLTDSATDLDRAAEILGTGGTVAFPTETVYGLGADARDGTAVARIYEAKGRPAFNPLIVHVSDLAEAQRYGDFSDVSLGLAEAFWPGPLTLVVPLAEASPLSSLVTAGLSSVGLRVPAHPVAQALLRRFAGPLAAPSANPSGRISPTTARHVASGLDGQIDTILDGGACPVGVESTIIDCTAQPTLLRPGGLAPDDIAKVLGHDITVQATPNGTAPTAPGQLASHYAPRKPVRLNVQEPHQDEAYLAFGTADAQVETLSATADLHEAAANLFSALHRLDAAPEPRIAIAPIPEQGLGLAINDRLRRAAAPRPKAYER